MNPATAQILYTVEETLVFSLVTVGMYLSFRMMKFPDFSAEGGFGLGAIVGAMTLRATGSPAMGVIAGTVGGAVCGLATALLANLTRLPTILASILTMTMAVSVALLVAGQPSMSIQSAGLLAVMFPQADAPLWPGLLGGLLFIAVAIGGLAVLSHTGVGFLLRIRGENPRLAQELGHSLLAWDVVGLCIANGMVGMAAVLFSQRAGYASIHMGRGVAISAIAAILLGEALFPNRSIVQSLVGCAFGTLVLRLVRLLALNIGLPDGTLDLVTSGLIILFYFLAKIRPSGTMHLLENIRM